MADCGSGCQSIGCKNLPVAFTSSSIVEEPSLKDLEITELIDEANKEAEIMTVMMKTTKTKKLMKK